MQRRPLRSAVHKLQLQTSTDEDIEEVHPAANQQCVVIRACVIRDTSAAVTLPTNDRHACSPCVQMG